MDSPFGTDIVEWFNQNPKGDPYTFRLNVYQNDLPVTEYDQQDLKLAVLRAGICAAGFPFMYLADFREPRMRPVTCTPRRKSRRALSRCRWFYPATS
nr:Uncharacterised protein [Klebsiella pneumoniae]